MPIFKNLPQIKVDKVKEKIKMDKSEKHLFTLPLQFFAEGGNGDGNEGGENGNQDVNGDNSNANNDNQNKNGNGDDGKGQKTFTQEEVNRMMTREKQQGKQSVLNALGFKTEDDAKSAFNLLKALQDSQKTAEQKAEENKNTAVQQKADAEQRAVMAEAKLSCVMNGVNKDAVDDVIVIAMSKVTDDKPLETVLTEMKSEARYASFFGDSNGSSGNTGRTPQNNNNGGNNNSTDYGKQIATQYGSGANQTVKSKFF